MPVSPARAAAFDILLRVERDLAFASDLLHAPETATLSREDHALTTELVMSVLRWRDRLDVALAPLLLKPLAKLDLEVVLALRLAACQLLLLDRIPAHAAVHESVELVKRARKTSAAGFVNAVLRKLKPEARPAQPGQTAAALASSYSHPLWLVDRWARDFGYATAQRVCAAGQRAPTSAIRVHDAAAVEELRAEGIELGPGLLLGSALRVRLGNIAATAALREGRIAIQDEASQLVAVLVGHGARMLDACAAPGGKTALLAERNPQAEIVATEISPPRAQLLRQRVSAANVQVITTDVRVLPVRQPFDRILVDAPCSGTGTLAHHPEIKWRLQAADLVRQQKNQAEILRAALAHLAPGGRLLYSTCSLEPEENETVVKQTLAAVPGIQLLDLRPDLTQLHEGDELTWQDIDSLTSGPYLRTFPGVHPCDGFFAALLEKL
jgi:16S rRNA (cytosine967-C5)-methyltransferase